jgi:glutamine synthetase
MAKLDEQLAGSSMHLHSSLWADGGARAAFDAPAAAGALPDLCRWWLGGLMHHARACTLLFAPYVNSYKRFKAGSFAPTAIVWARDNRTAGFRIVGHGPSLRVECRIPGADANPYLAFAATLAAGLDGIAQRIEPPTRFDGDAYAAGDVPRVPATLPEAIAEFAASALFRTAFGAEVVEHLVHFARTEQRKFDETVTTWERRRYLERA